ncbi:MAG: hypothetical protein ABIL58_13015 [Pseudomonadota bacterium]
MTLQTHRNMALWALRDLLQRPGEALLTAGVLALLTLSIGTPLLISQCLSRTMGAILAASPAMVVRRTDPTGWRPIPVSAAESASKIPGAISVRARIWGRVASASGPVTVIAWMPPATALPAWPLQPPAPGTLAAGAGVLAPEGRITLFHTDGTPAVFTVSGLVPPDAGLPATDLLILRPDEARSLLDIPEGHATDLTVDAFHETEISAISTELISRLPFPVHIDDRISAAGRYYASLAAAGGTRIARFFPAVLTLSLLVLVSVRQQHANTGETYLLRAMGWSAADMYRRRLYAALWVGLPAVALGAAAAYALVAMPDLAALGALLWGRALPADTSMAVTADLAIVLVEISALVLIPYLVSVVLAGVNASARSALHWPKDTGGLP